ncbi:hypothetical protein EGW08_013702 [Elysia chlorotica]|uniref:Uncharacterized protein n=1 Tax=Elysia chlorotica TaxID=188477 RepID=A0A3S1BDW2_ELYCH|nr:hypothetical protein EGW08_013702 [Elysia chlorotica]
MSIASEVNVTSVELRGKQSLKVGGRMSLKLKPCFSSCFWFTRVTIATSDMACFAREGFSTGLTGRVFNTVCEICVFFWGGPFVTVLVKALGCASFQYQIKS